MVSRAGAILYKRKQLVCVVCSLLHLRKNERRVRMLLPKILQLRSKPAIEEDKSQQRKSRKGPLFLGIALMALGLILSKTTLERTSICGPPITSRLFTTMILTGRLVLVVSGLYFLFQRPTIRRANVLLSIASTVFSILVCALILQVFYQPIPIISGWRSSAPKVEQNQLGFRGQSITYSDTDFVIVLLGDSQVEARSSAYGWMPERRLQFYLNSLGKRVKVFTLGVGGYGTDQELLALREYYQQYRADLVVLWETANDVWNNVFPTYFPVNGTPKPTFWLEHSTLHGPSEKIGQDINPSITLFALLRRYCHADRDGKWEKYLPQPFSPMFTHDGPVSQEWEQQSALGLWPDNLSPEKGTFALYLTPRSERMQYGLDLTRRLLHEIETLVSSNNGKFVIFSAEEPQLETTSSAEVVQILKGKYYRTSHDQYKKNISYINEVFDYYTIPITIEDWQVGPTDDHLNEHANDQVMRDLASKLDNLITYKVKLGHAWTP